MSIDKKINKDSGEYKRGIANLKILLQQLDITLKALAQRSFVNESKMASVFASLRDYTTFEWISIFSTLYEVIGEKKEHLIEIQQYDLAKKNLEKAKRNILVFSDVMNGLLLKSDLNYIDFYDDSKLYDFIENIHKKIGFINGPALCGKTTFLKNFILANNNRTDRIIFYFDIKELSADLKNGTFSLEENYKKLINGITSFIYNHLIEIDSKFSSFTNDVENDIPEIQFQRMINYLLENKHSFKWEKIVFIFDNLEFLWMKTGNVEIISKFFLEFKECCYEKEKNSSHSLYLIYSYTFFPEVNTFEGSARDSSFVISLSTQLDEFQGYDDKTIQDLCLLIYPELNENKKLSEQDKLNPLNTIEKIEERNIEKYDKLRGYRRNINRVSYKISGLTSALLYKLYTGEILMNDIVNLAHSTNKITKQLFLEQNFKELFSRYKLKHEILHNFYNQIKDEVNDELISEALKNNFLNLFSLVN